MTDMKWRLAKIEKATLFHEDHGFLTSYLYLEWPGGGQGCGGLALGRFDITPAANWDESHLKASAYLHRWIVGVMTCVGADDWGDVAGKRVWMLSDWGHVYAIRNLEGDRIFWIQEEKEDEFGHISATEDFRL